MVKKNANRKYLSAPETQSRPADRVQLGPHALRACLRMQETKMTNMQLGKQTWLHPPPAFPSLSIATRQHDYLRADDGLRYAQALVNVFKLTAEAVMQG